MRLLIRAGRVLDPDSGTDQELDVLVEDGRIARIGFALPSEADDTIDARGAWVIPGPIDMHVHLRQPGQEHKETVATGTRSAAAGGVTAVACMANTRPPIDNLSVLEYVRAVARREAAVEVHVVAAATKGLEGRELTEMGELAQAGAVAFSDDGQAIADASVMRSALLYARQVGRPLIAHAVDPSLAQGGVMRESLASFRLGLAGIPAEAESVMVARDVELALATGAHLHVAHVSTAAAVDHIRRARARGARVTAEVTPHHLFLTCDALEGFDPSAKVNPPLGTEEDRRALRQALADGTLDCVASDHAPHAPEEKEVELDDAPFGAVGLETLLPLVLGGLVEEGVLTPLQAVRVLTLNPARVLGLTGAGRLQVGARADITVFDPARRWVVDPAGLHSRSRNTPFAGWSLKGKAVATIVGGRPVMREGELVV